MKKILTGIFALLLCTAICSGCGAQTQPASSAAPETAAAPAAETTEAAANAESPFTDVEAGSWYADAVQWAVGAGVTKGMTDTTFEPDGTCTRAQIVTFLFRADAQS